MLPEQKNSATNPEQKLHFSVILPKLHRRDQIVINNDLGIKVGSTNGEKTALVVVCANKTPITLSSPPNKTIAPSTKKGDHVFFALSLAKGESAQVGDYCLSASTHDNGVNVLIIAHKAIKTRPVPRRHSLRRELTKLSSGDTL